MDMHTLWISILLGLASLVTGYFDIPGMDALDEPLFVADSQPFPVPSWSDNSRAKWPSGFKPVIPQVHSFYLKMDNPHSKIKPSGEDFFSHRPPSLSLPPSNFPRGSSILRPAQETTGFPDTFPGSRLIGSEFEAKLPLTSSSKKFLPREPPSSPMSELNGSVFKDEERPAGIGEQRVVGGRDVADGEIPWQVSLQRKSMKSGRIFHICGGSIINREWVVTAAHCVALALLSNYRIVAATTNLRDENRIKGLHSSDYSVHKVVDVQIHDEYDMFRFLNDIALIRIEPPFEYGNKIQAISLPHSGHTAHGMAYASGWGLTQEGVRVTPSRLQAVALPIVSDGECRQAYGDNLAESMICAGYREGGKSVCQGDSGGPLFQNQGGHAVLIGVVSWGVGCARPGKPGVYTEVSHYVGWIQDVTGGGRRQNFVR